MCVISMVHDHFNPMIPDITQIMQPGTVIEPIDWSKLLGGADLAELRQLIADFRAAVDAAKTVDALTKQADCLDPEKAKLEERVKRLEKVIDILMAAK